VSDNKGDLTGAVWLADPTTGNWLYSGELKGTHTGNSVQWTTTGIIQVRGTVSGSRIKGQIEYAASGGEPSRSYPLDLTVEKP